MTENLVPISRSATRSLRSPGKLDLSTVFGVALSLTGILGGLILEGGSVIDVSQMTAAFIVLGGTLGAVMVTTPLSLLIAAVKKLPDVFWDSTVASQPLIERIILFAMRARKNGLVSLERDVEALPEPFLKKALSLAVDGAGLQDIRRILELEISLAESRGEAEARVFECAGGYAPTIGIIGAVLGLIQVMKHLEDMEAVGHGIAVAFVATVYGVGVANLFLLPAANKLKLRLRQTLQAKELMLEGVISIAEGLNPQLIRIKLEAFQSNDTAGSKPKQARAAAAPRPRTASVR